MIPILICVPFWKGDQDQAYQVCKIMAGLQKGHVGNIAQVMLVARQDCNIDINMVKVISAKFNTLTFKSNSPLKGWPAGPNGMFGSTMIHIAGMGANKYECVYWMEPDCVPIRPNWFWDLVLEWRKKHPQAKIIGCRSDCNGNGTGDHISGSCLYDPQIAKIFPPITTSSNIAWDYQHRAKIVSMGGHTKLIENWYKATKAPHGIVEKPGVVVIHGFKDNSLMNLVKNKYNIH